MSAHIPRLRGARGGIALVLVVIAMTLATVMAYGMLASSVTLEQATSNQTSAAQADMLAESGVQLAMYYLQHPNQAPSLTAGSADIPSYWAGNSNLSFSGVTGSCNVTVAPSGTGGTLWTISSIGTASGVGGSVTRTHTATAKVTGTFTIAQALTSNSALQINSGWVIKGSPTAISSKGTVKVKAGATVTGNVYASSVTGHFTGTLYSAPTNTPVPPTDGTLGSYSNYTYSGVSYPAVLLGTGIAAILTPTNPGGVFEMPSGDLTLVGPMSIPGTVYVPKGNLYIIGSVTIGPPAPGLPAVIVSGNIDESLLLSSLSVNGAAYAGGSLQCSDLTCSATINGALLTNGDLSGFPGSLSVTYNSALVNVPGLSTAGAYITPQAVKLTTYNP